MIAAQSRMPRGVRVFALTNIALRLTPGTAPGLEPEPAQIERPILDGSETKGRNLTVTCVHKLAFQLQTAFFFPYYSNFSLLHS